MSDLCMYELDDIVWDDFPQSDDHIVPHPSDEQSCENLVCGNTRKKPRKEVTCVAGDAGKSVNQQQTEQKTLMLYERRDEMLEKESWSHKPDDGLNSSCCNEPMKEISTLASDSGTTSSHCLKSNIESGSSELCPTDSVLNGKSSTIDNSFGYPLDQISDTDNGLSFFGNGHEDKDSNDLLYYNWSDIGNFEDVDRLFRSCDSTFGLGPSSEDDLGWFSSSDAIRGTEDALKSEFKFSSPGPGEPKSMTEAHDPCTLNGTGNESTMQNIMYRDNSWPKNEDASSPLGHISFSNGSSSKDGFIPEEQEIEFKAGAPLRISDDSCPKNVKTNKAANVPRKQQKRHKPSEIQRTDQYMENGSFFSVGDVPEIVQKQRGTDSFGFMRSDMPYMSGYDHSSDHTSPQPISAGVKIKSSSISSISPKASYVASHSNSLEGSTNPSFQVISVTSKEKGERIHQQRGFQTTFDNQNVGIAVQTPKGGPVEVEKKAHYSSNEFKDHVEEIGAKLRISAELGSCAGQESSSTKSSLDDISVEATSFRQLQLVMEQLDLRTKLCIRDSLYRLARSAEQRHTGAKLGSGCLDDCDADRAIVAEGKHKYTGFMDLETDTNPIDRSVAHLLFHRPSDSSSVVPSDDTVSFNSPAPVHASISSSGLVGEERFVKREETAGEAERKVAGS